MHNCDPVKSMQWNGSGCGERINQTGNGGRRGEENVATTTVEKLKDYVFNTPSDPLRSVECVAQRCELIDRNLALLQKA